MKEQEDRDPRKPYSHPELRRVQLNREESLSAGCKTMSLAASGFSPCNVNTCMDLGS
jgi:hypothetical protein